MSVKTGTLSADTANMAVTAAGAAVETAAGAEGHGAHCGQAGHGPPAVFRPGAVEQPARASANITKVTFLMEDLP
jgi:hypothetical protein